MLARLDRVLAPLTWLAAAFAVVVLAVGPEMIGAKAEKPVDPYGKPVAAEPADTSADASAGEAVFASKCAGCHTLSAAGASGSVGPDLDELRPDAATVVTTVTEGKGSMPAFGGDLAAAEIDAVAAYVSTVAGG